MQDEAAAATHVPGFPWTYPAMFVWRTRLFFPHNLMLPRIPWSLLGILIMELLQLGVRRSNAPEDHSSKSVEPTSRER
jgi:hypothetical protein